MAKEHIVARVEEIPVGAKRIVNLDGVEIGIFNVKGTYYALPNHCFHQGGPLCEGFVGGTVMTTAASGWKPEWVQEGEIVVCPWHGMEFNITTGRCLARRRARLRQFRVRVADGEIRVSV
ncbi:MAG TPA: Rieske 2Fe-2S domain-containing protein [Chloroflexota bacterium]|nr:Rieske 2Fe-2S domain-containing protein [Chloroflexota bacterium]